MSRVLSFVATLVILPLSVRAEYADTTGSLAAGSLSFAGEFQVETFDPSVMSVNLHEAVGLATGVDLVLRQGLPIDNQGFYFGGGIKWTLLSASSRARRPGVSAFAGGHGSTAGYGGADGAILVDYPIGRFRPYLGLDANIEFGRGNDDIQLLLGLYGGTRIALVKNVSWFVEAGLGILGDPRPHFIATGPRVYLW
jgi:hypothetical protein